MGVWGCYASLRKLHGGRELREAQQDKAPVAAKVCGDEDVWQRRCVREQTVVPGGMDA